MPRRRGEPQAAQSPSSRPGSGVPVRAGVVIPGVRARTIDRESEADRSMPPISPTRRCSAALSHTQHLVAALLERPVLLGDERRQRQLLPPRLTAPAPARARPACWSFDREYLDGLGRAEVGRGGRRDHAEQEGRIRRVPVHARARTLRRDHERPQEGSRSSASSVSIPSSCSDAGARAPQERLLGAGPAHRHAAGAEASYSRRVAHAGGTITISPPSARIGLQALEEAPARSGTPRPARSSANGPYGSSLPSARSRARPTRAQARSMPSVKT